MTRTFTVLLVIASASLAIAGGRATAAGQGSAPCTAVAANSGTATFSSFGDGAFYLDASPTTSSPVLSDGATLVANCMRSAGIQPVVRFYARSISGTGSIHVEILQKRGSVVLDGGYVTAGATLAPVQAVSIPWDRRGNGSTDLQVRLTAVGGDFEIGSIFIDPYMQK